MSVSEPLRYAEPILRSPSPDEIYRAIKRDRQNLLTVMVYSWEKPENRTLVSLLNILKDVNINTDPVD